MMNLNERLDHLRTVIQTPEFLHGEGLSNEVNIRIFCYDPKEEMAVRHFVSQLAADPSLHCRLMERNLYRIFLSICDEKRITAGAASMEEKKGREYLRSQIQRFANNKTFVAKMQYAPHETGDVLLVTGVGEVYPFMRVHALLEALQPEFSDMPIVVMYPGEYTGHYLQLFGEFEPNAYYRAFNLITEDAK